MNICGDLLHCDLVDSNDVSVITIQQGILYCMWKCADNDKYGCCFDCRLKTCEHHNVHIKVERKTSKNKKLIKQYLMLNKLRGE